MKNFISIGLLCVSICFYSCKKDKQTEPETQTQTTTTPIPNYSALKVGNYWIYERFETDQFGISTSLNIIDSCYIEKDTTINGQQYFKYVQPQIVSYNPTISSTANSFRYIYDSLSYIIPYPRYNNDIWNSEKDCDICFTLNGNTFKTPAKTKNMQNIIK